MLSLTCCIFLRVFPFLCHLFTSGKRSSKQQNCKKKPSAIQAAHQRSYTHILESLTTASLLKPSAHTTSHLGRHTLPSAPGPVSTHTGIARSKAVPQAQPASRPATSGLCVTVDRFLLWFVASVAQEGSQPAPAPCLTALSFSRFERASINYPTIMN